MATHPDPSPDYEFDQWGQLVPFDPSRKRPRKRLTNEERKIHRTRAWFCRQLLAVANGDVVMTAQQYRALVAFGRARGWNRRPADKKPSRNRLLR